MQSGGPSFIFFRDVHSTEPLDDLSVVYTAKQYNEQADSVLSFGTLMTVVLDWRARVLACGWPDQAKSLFVERRHDGLDVVHTTVYNIQDASFKSIMSIILLFNGDNRWTESFSVRHFLTRMHQVDAAM